MRPKTHEMINRVKKELQDNEYMSAKQIAECIGLRVGSACRIIRLIRMQGIGVHTTKDGYILSSRARKTDDVGFLRRLNGRRTSDVIALTASEGSIKSRWNSVKDKRQLNLIVGPLAGNPARLQKGLKALISRVNGKGL